MFWSVLTLLPSIQVAKKNDAAETDETKGEEVG
jgi:hypothetical protein